WCDRELRPISDATGQRACGACGVARSGRGDQAQGFSWRSRRRGSRGGGLVDRSRAQCSARRWSNAAPGWHAAIEARRAEPRAGGHATVLRRIGCTVNLRWAPAPSRSASPVASTVERYGAAWLSWIDRRGHSADEAPTATQARSALETDSSLKVRAAAVIRVSA